MEKVGSSKGRLEEVKNFSLNFKDIADHLKLLFENKKPEEWVELRFIRDVAIPRFFQTVDDAVEFIKKSAENLRDFDIYVGINLRAVKPEKR